MGGYLKDNEVRRMFKLSEEKKQSEIAAQMCRDPKTVRKYQRAGKLPSELAKDRTWRTHTDDFAEVWPEIEMRLKGDVLEAGFILEQLQSQYPDKYHDSQLRTLQRRIKNWRATSGPLKEVFFEQKYLPGMDSQSDFTDMADVGVTIQRRPFPHKLYHFTLCYSGWESVTLCYSETFESVSEGFQDALWRLGGAPQRHKTDCLSAAVKEVGGQKNFTARYNGLMTAYGVKPQRIQPAHPNENGKIERSHGPLKSRLRQSLAYRESSDFDSEEAYAVFVQAKFSRQNKARVERLAEEIAVLTALPPNRIDHHRVDFARVTKYSTIQVKGNTYSVNSRLIGETVEVRTYACKIDIRFGQVLVQTMPRKVGKGIVSIDFRHVIHSLSRKPGAFANYKHQAQMFPRTIYRMAYDRLVEWNPDAAAKEYLKILLIAAEAGEECVSLQLEMLLKPNTPLFAAEIKTGLGQIPVSKFPPDVKIDTIDLKQYDTLLEAI